MKTKRDILKEYFVKGAIPTQANFAELIDAAFNVADDGLVKPPNEPLKITAAAPEEGLIQFHRLAPGQGQSQLTWQIKHGSGGKDGFNLVDAGGVTRLFIETGTGNIGIGTDQPGAKLDVRGDARLQLQEEDWKVPTLNDPWVNYSHEYNPAGYFRDSMGMVHLRGLVKKNWTKPEPPRPAFNVDDDDIRGGKMRGGGIRNPLYQDATYQQRLIQWQADKAAWDVEHAVFFGAVSNFTLCQLPPGYRPAYRQLHCVQINPAVAGRVDIDVAGSIVIVVGNGGWVSLDGITFRAAG
ncbi:MAG TPA: hypothetical protein PLX89_20920 [Verrucomicrobiota bacterium]|nr:hypothetical protein [Verrucomicrobiota bacterium]